MKNAIPPKEKPAPKPLPKELLNEWYCELVATAKKPTTPTIPDIMKSAAFLET
jgi:hypothetical protein